MYVGRRSRRKQNAGLVFADRGTQRFDGLQARVGDRAYLFLHDGHEVRKIIAGSAEWAERLFDGGYGPAEPDDLLDG